MSRLYTIGFTKKTAKQFFEALEAAAVRRVIDTRLNNRSQLAGFSKADDLAFFLERVSGIDYLYEPSLAPTQDLLDRYKKQKGQWDEYAADYLNLIKGREPERRFSALELDGSCFLCSEHEPDHCHRRLAAEYFQSAYPQIEVVHLGLAKKARGAR